MKVSTWRVLILIYVVSRSLRHQPSQKGDRILALLYSELSARYPLPLAIKHRKARPAPMSKYK